MSLSKGDKVNISIISSWCLFLASILITFIVLSALTFNDININKKCFIDEIIINNCEICSNGKKNMIIYVNYNSKLYDFLIVCADNNTYYLHNEIPCYYFGFGSVTLSKSDAMFWSISLFLICIIAFFSIIVSSIIFTYCFYKPSHVLKNDVKENDVDRVKEQLINEIDEIEISENNQNNKVIEINGKELESNHYVFKLL